jgi:hypothetical protein
MIDAVMSLETDANGPAELVELPPPPRLTIREIADESLLIDALLEQAAGELTPELEQRLDQLGEAILNNTDGINAYLDGLEADAAVQREEEKRLAEKRRKLQARADRFDRFVHDQMVRMNRRSLPGRFSALDIVNNPPKLVITDRALLPAHYITTEHVPATVVETVHEDTIKADLMAREKAIAAQHKVIAQAEKKGLPAPTFDPASLPPDVPGAMLVRATRLRRG